MLAPKWEELRFEREAARSGIRFTLGEGKLGTSFHLSPSEAEAYCHFHYQRFHPHRSFAALKEAINHCFRYDQLEALAYQDELCDDCDFSDLDVAVVKLTLIALADCYYRYPRLRGRLNYLGSPTHFKAALEAFKDRKEGKKRLGLDFFNSAARSVFARTALASCADQFVDRPYLAIHIDLYDLYGTILLDEQNYQGFAYSKSVAAARRGSDEGYFPMGCHPPSYVLYHELGHALDHLGLVQESKRFQAFYAQLTPEEIKEKLSEYGRTDSCEFVAEAFAESRCSPHPREIAVRVAKLIDQRCR